MSCGASTLRSLGGSSQKFVRLYCTLPEEHAGEHYDETFSQSWAAIRQLR